MQDNHRRGATDEIIGHTFRRSLLAAGVLAALALAFILAGRMKQRDQDVVETPTATPVAVGYEVQAPPVRFTDVTRQAGIDFTHVNGAYGDKLLPETMGSGAAFFDYDNDTDQDLLLVNSDHWPDRARGDESRPTMKLYANDGYGRFQDVT